MPLNSPNPHLLTQAQWKMQWRISGRIFFMWKDNLQIVFFHSFLFFYPSSINSYFYLESPVFLSGLLEKSCTDSESQEPMMSWKVHLLFFIYSTFTCSLNINFPTNCGLVSEALVALHIQADTMRHFDSSNYFRKSSISYHRINLQTILRLSQKTY